MRKLYLLLVAILALGLSGVALADDHGSGWGDSGGSGNGGHEAAHAHLQALGGSGVTGKAELHAQGDATHVVIHLEGGFEQDVEMPAHLHEGTLDEYDPKPKYPLENVVDGTSESTVEVSLEEILSEDFIVAVHESEENIANVVAAGQVETAHEDDTQQGEDVQMPDTGAGGMADSRSSVPVAGLALVGAVLAADTFLVTRARGI